MTGGAAAVPGPAPAPTEPTEPTDADHQVHRMARAGSLNLVAAVISGGTSVVLVLLVTNSFGKEVSGTLFASTALFLLLASICELGTDAGLSRVIPRYLVARRPRAVRRALRVAAYPVAAVSAAVGVGLLVFAPQVADLIGDDAGNRADLVAALRLLAVCLPVTTLYDTALAATRAHGSIGATVAVERIGRSVVQLAAIVAVGVVGGGAVGLVLAWSAPYVASLAATTAWLRTLRHRSTAALADAGDPKPVDVRATFWRFTTPRALGQITQVGLQRLDIVLVAGMIGLQAGAVYTAATRFLVFGQIGVLAVQQVLQPQLSELLARDDHAGASRIFTTATAWIMALTWPIYLTFAAIAPVAMDVFGRGYQGGEATVVILSLTMLLSTAAGPVDVVLLMSGRSTLSLLNNVAALAVNVVLNLALIPHLGITGAAVAWAAAIVVRNVLPFVQVRRDLGMTAVGPATRTVAVCTFVPLAVAGPLARWGIAAGHPAAALLVVPALAVAAAGLWRTRHQTGVGMLLSVLKGGGRRRLPAATS